MTIKENVITEIQELQKLGLCQNLDLVEKVYRGDYDDTIEESSNMDITSLTDMIVQLDQL